MIGVTVGIGQEKVGAEKAAGLFKEHTGLPCVILGDTEYEASGMDSPNALRLNLFDFVQDDSVVYFDADLWFQRPWDPLVFSDGYMYVVRDINNMIHIMDDAEAWVIPTCNYFNSGFMILNRSHEPMLKMAYKLLQHFRHRLAPYLAEQSPLNAAVKLMGTPIRYLDRRYNWVQSAGSWISRGVPVIGAHKYRAGQKSADMFHTAPNKPDTFLDIVQSDFSEFAGVYTYNRVGHDTRLIELLLDGNIGLGADRMEQWWLPYRLDDARHIILYGYQSDAKLSEEEETCRLTRTQDGSFEGNWTNFERMPIRLERTTVEAHIGIAFGTPDNKRAGVVGRLLRDRPATSRRAAEVGVLSGETAEVILRDVPGIEYHMIDPWEVNMEASYRGTNDHAAYMDERTATLYFNQARRRTNFASDRRILVRHKSVPASRRYTNEYFDLVFIDAEHSYAAVVADIRAWWPKVKYGGILAGHDYGYPTFDGSTFGPEVKKAVDEFVQRTGLRLVLEEDYVWYVVKN